MQDFYSRVGGFCYLPRREQRRRILRRLLHRYLSKTSGGVLHIGAHEGIEAGRYGDKSVIWFEANPELIPGLNRNLMNFPNQRAVCALLGDCRREVEFHISSNSGYSSSLFPFGPYSNGEKSLWPHLNLHMERTMRLEMQTLDEVVEQQGIDAAHFNTWVLDVQGADC